jgi:hypothetical protein
MTPPDHTSMAQIKSPRGYAQRQITVVARWINDASLPSPQAIRARRRHQPRQRRDGRSSATPSRRALYSNLKCESYSARHGERRGRVLTGRDEAQRSDRGEWVVCDGFSHRREIHRALAAHRPRIPHDDVRKP